MGKAIHLFMWGYQEYFRVAVEYRAKNVLQSIAPTIEPKVFLVGVRVPENTQGNPVCVEPEDGEWDPKVFFNCSSRVETIYANHPDHRIIYGDEPRMRDKPENIRRKSVREAVQEVLADYDSKHGTLSFCGWPMRHEGYHVLPILQLDKNKFLEYPYLPAPIRLNEWTSSTGLLQSIVDCLLVEASDALEKREPGRFFGIFPSEDVTILREAADGFCNAVRLATGDAMLQGVFTAINEISSLPYEGSAACGGIIFSPANHPAVKIRIRLREPAPIHTYKLVRKIVEVSAPELLCVCNGVNGIMGFGSLQDSNSDGIFYVKFSGRNKWELFYRNKLIMKVDFGVPGFFSLPIKESVFRSDIQRLIPNIEIDVENRLWNVIQEGIKQKHGTMIVISTDAAKEAERLKKQSLGIEPIELTPELVCRISGIDGAILIDQNGVCHAIGVILDGMATDEGDSSRGARYNSAIRYISSARHSTICLVVSEDGHVDMLPKLRPQINKVEIEKRIALIKTQNKDNYNKVIHWFDAHRFYLTPEQCEVINNEMDRINKTPFEQGEIRLSIRQFKADSSMNDSYYLKE